MYVSSYYSKVHGLWPVEFSNGGLGEYTNAATCSVWSSLAFLKLFSSGNHFH